MHARDEKQRAMQLKGEVDNLRGELEETR